MQRKKLFRILIPALVVALILFFAGGVWLSHILISKFVGTNSLVIGYGNRPPYVSVGMNGELMGADVDLANEYGRRTSTKIVWRKIPWELKEELLQNGTVDCIWGGIKESQVRTELFDSVYPYLRSALVMAVRSDSGITNETQLVGARVAYERTTTVESAIKGESAPLRALASTFGSTITVDSFSELPVYVENGSADAFIADYFAALSLCASYRNLRVIDRSLLDNRNTIFVRKGNGELRNKLTTVLRQMDLDGTISEILSRWKCVNAPRHVLRDSKHNQARRNVLFIYTRGMDDNFEYSLFRRLESTMIERRERVDFSVVQLHSVPNVDESVASYSINNIQEHLESGVLDLVVACGNTAIELFSKGIVKNPGATPLICVNWSGEITDEIQSRIDGPILCTPSTTFENVELSRRIMPGCRIAVVVDGSKDGVWQARAVERLNKDPNVTVYVSGRISTHGLLNELSLYGPNDVVIVTSWSGTENDQYSDASSIIGQIRSRTDALVLGKYIEYMEVGTDGGIMTSPNDLGSAAANLASKIFDGTPVSDLEDIQLPPHPRLSATALVMHRISRHSVPPDVQIVDTTRDSNITSLQMRSLVVFTLVLAIIVIVIIIMLYNPEQIEARKRANDELLRLKAYSDNFEKLSRLSGVAWFNTDMTTGATECSSVFSTIWPMRGGNALPVREVLTGKELVAFQSFVAYVMKSQPGSFRSLDFTTSYWGDPRQLRITMARVKGESRTEGIIQDISKVSHSIARVENTISIMQSAIDLMPTAFCVKYLAGEGRRIYCNSTYASMFDKTPDKVIGRSDGEIASKDASAAMLREDIAATAAGGMPVTSMRTVKHRDGTSSTIRITKRTLSDANGRALLLIEGVDITESNDTEHQRSLLFEAVETMLSGVSFSDTVDRYMRSIFWHLGADMIFLATTSKAGSLSVITLRDARNVVNDVRVIHDEFLSAITDRIRGDSATPIFERDVLSSPIKPYRQIHKCGVRSFAAIPVVNSGELQGVVFICYFRPNVFQKWRYGMIESVATMFNLAFIRRNEKLKSSHQIAIRSLVLSNLVSPTYLYNATGNLIVSSNRDEKLASSFDPMVANVVEGGTFLEYEKRGNGVVSRISYKPIYGADNKVVYVVKTITDVSDFRYTIEGLRMANQCFEESMDYDKDNFDAIIESVRYTLGADFCMLLLMYRDQDNDSDTSESSRVYISKSDSSTAILCDNDTLFNTSLWQGLLSGYDAFRVVESREFEDVFPPNMLPMLRSAKAKFVVVSALYESGRFIGAVVSLLREYTPVMASWSKEVFTSICNIIQGVILKRFTRNRLNQALDQSRNIAKQRMMGLAREIGLNSEITALLRIDRMADAARLVLRSIVDMLGASRCYLSHICPAESTIRIDAFLDAGAFASSSDLSYSASIQPGFLIDKFPILFFGDATEAVEKLKNFGLSLDPNFTALVNARSLAVTAVQYGADEVGFIFVCFDGMPHEFEETDRSFLRIQKQLIEVFLQRYFYQQQTVRALEEAQAANKAKSFFIASISHEIRTPLNAIIGFSELLHDSKISLETRSEYLTGISNSGNALLQLINDVLDLSKLEADKMEFALQPTNFQQLCAETLSNFRYKSIQSGVALKYEVPLSIPTLNIDKNRIRQVMFNLLSNALKYTVRGSVTLSADYSDGWLHFSVIDTGIGIAKENQATLMDPYVQLKKTTANTTKGTGLGLAISKNIMLKLNGSLTLTSEEGKGSTFTASFPCDVSDEPLPSFVPDPAQFSGRTRATEVEEAIEISNSEGVTNTEADTGELKPEILIVDDQVINLQVLAAHLKKLGYGVVRKASSAEKALAMLEEKPADILITDLHMPGKDGRDLAREVRYKWGNMRVVLLTGSQTVFPREDTVLFDARLLKPLTEGKLIQIFSEFKFWTPKSFSQET